MHLRWKKEAISSPPVPRIDFSFVKATDNKCILFGGSDGYRFLNDMYILDIEKKMWTLIQPQNSHDQPNPSDPAGHKHLTRNLSFYDNRIKGGDSNVPTPRFGHSCVIFDEKMWLFGGWDGKSTLNDIWTFEWTSRKWKKISSYSDVAPRYRHTSIAYNNFMVVFGGVDHYHIRYPIWNAEF